MFFVRDPDIVKQIYIKDFDHFTDLGFMDPEVADMEVNDFGLANKKGEEWRSLKALVTPAFSLKNMKNLTPTVDRYSTTYTIYIACMLL